MPKKRPLIGLTSYRKVVTQDPLLEINGLNPAYTKAISAAGGLPVMIPLYLDEASLLELFEQLDGLLMPGGGDINPLHYGGTMHETVYGIDNTRDQVELLLARKAVETDKPFLGICRGHQMLNVALGGSLWEDVHSLMPNGTRHAYFQGFPRDRISHQVNIEPHSGLGKLWAVPTKAVNSLHHQGVKELGRGLRPTAYAADDGLIEGTELPGHRFVMSVQWHPEEFFHTDRPTLSLFEAFVQACH